MNRIVTTEKTTIYHLNSQGEGVGQNEEGKTITLPFTLPLEKVVYECHTYKRKKNYYFKEVLSNSPSRINPICPHFQKCGGCLLQHMDKISYQEYKKAQVTQPLIEHGLNSFCVEDVHILPFGQRRRANLEAIRKEDDVYLGFHRYKSHQIINIDECHTMAPSLVSLLKPLKEALKEVLEPFQKAKIFITLTKVGLDVSLEIQGVDKLLDYKREALKKVAENCNCARFIFKYRKTTDIIYFKAEPVVLFDGVDVKTDAYSFLQATQEADEHLSHLVINLLPQKLNHIVDLFCGRGTLTLPLSRLAPVKGYEFDKPALNALQEAIDTSHRPIQLFHKNLFDDPLKAYEFENVDVIVIDPPRAGALAQIQEIAQTQVKSVVYVSCNPQTFARDAAILQKTGYTLQKVIPVDQFAWSPHVEVVALLTK